MNTVRTYNPNSGQFRKGFTPWNKGTNKGGRTDARKRVKGYQPREVVAINPDGTVYKRFKSVEAAKDFFGLSDRHSITHACQGKYLTRGMRLMYGEDYIPWADYRYPKRRFRDIYGRLLPGHHNTGFRPLSEENRKKRASAHGGSQRRWRETRIVIGAKGIALFQSYAWKLASVSPPTRQRPNIITSGPTKYHQPLAEAVSATG